MAKLKFHIHNPGDPSVGLFPIDSVVIMEDNMIWSQELIQETKAFLAALYDTKTKNVITERELLESQLKEEEMEIDYRQTELECLNRTEENKEAADKFEARRLELIEASKKRLEQIKEELKNPELL